MKSEDINGEHYNLFIDEWDTHCQIYFDNGVPFSRLFYSGTLGFLPPIKNNSRYYSRFRTKAAAQRAINRIVKSGFRLHEQRSQT